MNAKEIKRQIKELRAEMKENNVRIVSCFNAGLSYEEYRCNSRLSRMKIQLSQAQANDSKIAAECHVAP